MRILIDGKIYDSTKTPVLIVFDENESKMFNDMKRFVSTPESITMEQRHGLIHTDIENIRDKTLSKYRVVGDDGERYGAFSNQNDAEEHAQEVADNIQKDVFVEKVTTELLSCLIPD